jgi:hypothetical protein
MDQIHSAHFAWLSQFRRLRVGYDKRADITTRSSRSGAVIWWQSLRTTETA